MEAGLSSGLATRPVVRSTATGAVTSTVPVPIGGAITAVVLRGAVVGSHSVSGAVPDNLAVEKISVATGQKLATLYHRRLGPTSQIVGAPHFLVLSADASGEHWLLNGGISGGAGYNNGFNGWIDHGRLIPLAPHDGWDADEAW